MAVLLLVLIPPVVLLPALLTLAVLAVVLGALLAWETNQYAQIRLQIRHDNTRPLTLGAGASGLLVDGFDVDGDAQGTADREHPGEQ